MDPDTYRIVEGTTVACRACDEEFTLTSHAVVAFAELIAFIQAHLDCPMVAISVGIPLRDARPR